MTLFVIGVLAGVVVLNIGSGDRDELVAREAQRLGQLMNLARDEALFAGTEWGLELGPDGYGFLALDRDSGRWQRVDARPFETHELPEGIALRLAIEGRDRVGASDARRLTRRGGLRPALMFLSSGEMTPFTLTVAGDADTRARQLHSDGFDRVALTRDDRAGAPGA